MMIATVIFFVLLGAVLGAALGYASQVFKVESNPLVDSIEAIMPGGQCGQCGVAGCRQAAEAMVRGELNPNACPLGGQSLTQQIADMLGVSVSMSDDDIEWVAHIQEAQCSGCGRCYKACPFDAIVGAAKQMHTVISDVCTGCKLCTESCPQGCLTMVQVAPDTRTWFWPKPQASAA
ncbi:RnfABCDGE type electron transport complex subunit B [Shewanella sp. C32]|uniref:Ion-translocating oxidoreductase complex subunit B n=1 Tax=Shewanella electrica TaxID=515560 RepID=A0ABT2FKZ8_9GAMM|nr:RnfABCDGE type electron transport complex subunit B [Shewanella electrica]MCH1924016.1 RnfABCDGE type electron transport complex subunit B [Shewanella electrica]MCS4555919.1 RnfABCDGE type electron transport complex subunit B [Shewanella electrica]